MNDELRAVCNYSPLNYKSTKTSGTLQEKLLIFINENINIASAEQG